MPTQKRKDFFALNNDELLLKKYGRIHELPISYDALLNYQDAFPLIDSNGNDTHWQTLVYEQGYGKSLYKGLKKTYTLLRSGGDEMTLHNRFFYRSR